MTEGAMYEYLQNYRGKEVTIGVPNFIHKNRLFLIDGLVTEVADGYLTLRIDRGYRRIPYDDIIEIRER